MGNWHISIRGVGPHHNAGDPAGDANVVARRVVQELKAAGHTIQDAAFTFGNHDDMGEPEAKVSPDAPAAVSPAAQPFP
jgi:hypothetical protein